MEASNDLASLMLLKGRARQARAMLPSSPQYGYGTGSTDRCLAVSHQTKKKKREKSASPGL
jgi:hypothetical protein